MKNPKVSIIIPVYNGADYLGEAIDSALAQTYRNIEVLVINDGSTDQGGTEKVAKNFGQRVKYFKKKNGGVASAINYGLKKMSGDYFSWLSHDDRYLPEKVAAEVRFLSQLPPRTVIYSDFNFINEKGELLWMAHLTEPPKGKLIYGLFISRFLHGCSLLIPKKAFDEVGQFREDLKNAQDYEMWFRIMKAGFSFRHLGEVLIEGRIHAKQGTVTRPQTQIQDEEIVYQWVLNNFSPKEIFGQVTDPVLHYLDIALAAKRAGLRETAKLAFAKAKEVKSAENILYDWVYRLYCQIWTEKLSLTHWKNKLVKLIR